jgi:hypothetical protein
MNKRILGTFLWAMVGWTGGSMLTYFAGLPEGVNLVLAMGLGGIVWFDPRHLLWPVAPTRRIRRADELIAEPRAPKSDLAIE